MGPPTGRAQATRQRSAEPTSHLANTASVADHLGPDSVRGRAQGADGGLRAPSLRQLHQADLEADRPTGDRHPLTDSSYASTYNTFASDTPDSELHELPSTCAHFVIDQDGAIHQLVSVGTICRHTVGLNWTALGIEQVGYSDRQVLGDRRQITASLGLVRWLRCRFHIEVRNVIGHNKSLSSPYHHEDVAALGTQTHADFNHADMQVYRARLRRLGGC